MTSNDSDMAVITTIREYARPCCCYVYYCCYLLLRLLLLLLLLLPLLLLLLLRLLLLLLLLLLQVWATGIKCRPIVNKLREAIGLKVQNNFRGLVTDEFLEVRQGYGRGGREGWEGRGGRAARD